MISLTLSKFLKKRWNLGDKYQLHVRKAFPAISTIARWNVQLSRSVLTFIGGAPAEVKGPVFALESTVYEPDDL